MTAVASSMGGTAARFGLCRFALRTVFEVDSMSGGDVGECQHLVEVVDDPGSR